MSQAYRIRPAEPRDARGVAELRRMRGVFETILGYPSARDKSSEDYFAAFDDNHHEFVAVIPQEDGGELVIGMAGLVVSSNPRRRHSAGAGILVHRDYQGQGVGRRLMETLLDMADNWLMLVRVELTVFTDNEPAIRLYESLGFAAEGVKRKAAIRGGVYADELMMARIRPEQGKLIDP